MDKEDLVDLKGTLAVLLQARKEYEAEKYLIQKFKALENLDAYLTRQ